MQNVLKRKNMQKYFVTFFLQYQSFFFSHKWHFIPFCLFWYAYRKVIKIHIFFFKIPQKTVFCLTGRGGGVLRTSDSCIPKSALLKTKHFTVNWVEQNKRTLARRMNFQRPLLLHPLQKHFEGAEDDVDGIPLGTFLGTISKN